MSSWGKLYREQDKAVRSAVCSDLNVRVGRLDKWLPHCTAVTHAMTESGL